MELIYKQEFYDIKSASIALKNNLGLGFLEKVYENALKFELEERGFSVMQQHPIKVTYKNNVVGNYYTDLYIVDKIIIEIKTVNKITSIHKAQILNYLKATGIKLGVLVNFSRERNTVDIERVPNLI
ncbi:MAG: GxxExxY protein [Thermodesulfobacteriota bacterium]|nr:GxxExxY protein [Thermodesulfobacteriota bacterium]